MMEAIFSFVMPLLYLCGATVSLVILTKRSFGKCLPLAMMGSAFLLFFSQIIFSTFTVGFVVGVVWAIMSVGLVVWKRKQWKATYRELVLTPGLVAFLVVYVAVFIYDFARGFAVWDEFSHWGMMLKEMVRLDKFYSVEASNLMVHKDYPPIMQLFELFWVKLCGGFREAYAERALHTFGLSLFVPFVVEKVGEKKHIMRSVLVGALGFVAVASITILFDQHGVFHTIYNDYVMALVTAWLIATVFLARKMSWFEVMAVSVGGGFLVLLKQMGLPLYLMVVCVMVGLEVMRNKERLKLWLKKIGWGRLVAYAVMLVLPLVWYVLWSKITSEVPKQFDLANMGMMDFFRVLKGNGEEWQIITRDNYIEALGLENISTSFMLSSYIQGVVIFVVLGILLYKIFRKEMIWKEVVVTGAIMIFGALSYALAMLFLYTMAFGSYEGPILASFERYMGTFLIILFATEFLVFYEYILKYGKISRLVAIVIALVIMIVPAFGVRVRPRIHDNTNEVYAKYVDATEKLLEVTGEPEAKVFVVAQNTLGYHYYLQYFANPMKFNSYLFEWPVDGEVDATGFYEESVKKELEQYDYLYLAEIDDEFRMKYCDELKICPEENGNIYKIKLENHDIMFSKLNNTI